jgi:hypothetical protein
MAKMNFSISHEGHTNNMRSEKNIKGDEQDWETTAYSLIDFDPVTLGLSFLSFFPFFLGPVGSS